MKNHRNINVFDRFAAASMAKNPRPSTARGPSCAWQLPIMWCVKSSAARSTPILEGYPMSSTGWFRLVLFIILILEAGAAKVFNRLPKKVCSRSCGTALKVSGKSVRRLAWFVLLHGADSGCGYPEIRNGAFPFGVPVSLEDNPKKGYPWYPQKKTHILILIKLKLAVQRIACLFHSQITREEQLLCMGLNTAISTTTGLLGLGPAHRRTHVTVVQSGSDVFLSFCTSSAFWEQHCQTHERPFRWRCRYSTVHRPCCRGYARSAERFDLNVCRSLMLTHVVFRKRGPGTFTEHAQSNTDTAADPEVSLRLLLTFNLSDQVGREAWLLMVDKCRQICFPPG